MNIKREFLYTDKSKLIPLQLLKTNYGISDANPSTSIEEIDVQPTTRVLQIQFPFNSSNIAMLINKDQIVPQISEVRSSPPGTSLINLTIEEGKSYWLYVVSREYDDGYLGADYIVGSDEVTGDRFVIDVETMPQSIDLGAEDRMSKSVDETDITQWYGYDGHYTGGLVWSSPTIGSIDLDNENSWLIIRAEILSQIDNIFRQNNLKNYVLGNKSHSIRIFKILDDLAEFMKDKKVLYDDLLADDSDKIEDIWNFINSNLPGYNIEEVSDDNYYLTYTGKIGQWIDELGVYSDYILWNFLASETYPNADLAGQFASATNEERDSGFAYIFEGTTHHYDLMGLNSQDRHSGIYGGGKEARSLISGSWGGIPWVGTRSGNSSGIFDPRYNPTWNEFRNQKQDFIEDTNLDLERKYAIARHEYAGDQTENNRKWWEDVSNYGESSWTNVHGWLEESIEENNTLLIVAGDTAYPRTPGDTTGTTNNTGSTISQEFPQTQEAILQNLRFVKDQINSLDENLWTTVNSTTAMLLSTVMALKESIDSNRETSTIVNITDSTIGINAVDVLYRNVTGGTWTELPTSLNDIGNNVKVLDLSIVDFSIRGKYVVMVQPKKIEGNVLHSDGDYVIVRDDFNTAQTENYFYGYNAQFYTAEGDPIGTTKVITASKWQASDHWLKISPLLDGTVHIEADSKIILWPNDFIPITIEVDIVEHNALTLSYASYGKTERNTTTGLVTIYDYNGNVYKELSYGRHSNAATGNIIIEYRTPEDIPEY